MRSKEYTEIKEMLDAMTKAMITKADVEAIVDSKLSAMTVKAPAKPEKKATATKKTSAKSSKDSWAKYQPKADADGNWNFRSYKAARNRYLEDHGYGYETAGWLSREDFAKAVKPFEDKFGKYVKKADR